MQKFSEAISKQLTDRRVIGNWQHRFTRSKSCLTHPIDFYEEVTGAVSKGRAVDVAYVSEDFDNVLHSLYHEIGKIWAG